MLENLFDTQFHMLRDCWFIGNCCKF